MKGNDQLIEQLNALLAAELTAINQYMVHGEMCANWGYARLHKMVEKRAMTEMKHAEKLIERILFLDGRPIVSRLEDIRIGEAVPKQLESDLGLEKGAWKRYNDAIKLAADVGDHATKQLLEAILKDEDGHVDELEAQLDEVNQVGLQIYLGNQIRE